VDYKNGVLCWSATDRLLCSLYSPGKPLKVATALEPGSAVKAGICTGSLPVPELVNSITGVAIANTADSLSVYFGCYSDIAGVGGLGMVTVTNHGLSYILTKVSSGPTTVYGGSLFMTQGMSYYCPGVTTPSPSSTVRQTNTTHVANTTTSSAYTSHASSTVPGSSTRRPPCELPSQSPSTAGCSRLFQPSKLHLLFLALCVSLRTIISTESVHS